MATQLRFSEIQWICRASARIRELDPTIPLGDSVDLAAALVQRPGYRREAPEDAVETVFVREGRNVPRRSA
jgi:hypothetical protein